MEGTAQDTHKEQFMLKLMGRFIVLVVLGIGACVLLGGLLMAFRTGTSEPSRLFVGGQDIAPGEYAVRPDRPAERGPFP